MPTLRLCRRTSLHVLAARSLGITSVVVSAVTPVFSSSCLADVLALPPEGRWCGPQGNWTSLFIPDEWPDACNAYTRSAAFHVACRAHDACYETMGALRSDCDARFHADLRQACDDAFFTWACLPARQECRGVARVYFEAVVAWGEDPFRDAQGLSAPESPPPSVATRNTHGTLFAEGAPNP